jgi:hypothetical protein
VNVMNVAETQALERLLEIADRDTGQSCRVANFLLAWWNAERDGGFDLTDLWSVDTDICNDMLVIVGFITRSRTYPDSMGYGKRFEALVRDWRAPHCTEQA